MMLSFKRKPKPQSPFESIVEMAYEIRKENPEALHDLIRALLRPIQAEHILAVAERPMHAAPECIDQLGFFFPIGKVIDTSEYWIQPTPKITVDLRRDVVLPTPWHRHRFSDALATIGTGKAQGKWKCDPLNHGIAYWLPWRIAFVLGGNHSIAAGILAGEGQLDVTEVFQMAPLLELIETDGYVYRERATGKVIAKVKDHRRAAVFEIGRLLPNP